MEGLSTSPSTNTRIIGNSISGASNMGIYIFYHTAPKLIDNSLSNLVHSDYEALYLNNCHGQFQITGNRIDNGNRGHGIYINNCHATEFFRGLISNNMVRTGGNSTAKGMYLASSEYIDLYHNSINTTSSHKDNGYGLHLYSNNIGINIVRITQPVNLNRTNKGVAMELFMDLGRNSPVLCDFWPAGFFGGYA